MLGHSTIAINADTYTRALAEVAREAAEAAPRLVPSATSTGDHICCRSEQVGTYPQRSRGAHTAHVAVDDVTRVGGAQGVEQGDPHLGGALR